MKSLKLFSLFVLILMVLSVVNAFQSNAEDVKSTLSITSGGVYVDAIFGNTLTKNIGQDCRNFYTNCYLDHKGGNVCTNNEKCKNVVQQYINSVQNAQDKYLNSFSKNIDKKYKDAIKSHKSFDLKAYSYEVSVDLNLINSFYFQKCFDSNKNPIDSEVCKNVKNVIDQYKTIQRTLKSKQQQVYQSDMNSTITNFVHETFEDLNLNTLGISSGLNDLFETIQPDVYSYLSDILSPTCSYITSLVFSKDLCNASKLSIYVLSSYHKAWKKAALGDFADQPSAQLYGHNVMSQFTMDGTKYNLSAIQSQVKKKLYYFIQIYSGWRGNFTLILKSKMQSYRFCIDSSKKISLKYQCVGGEHEVLFGFNQDNPIKRLNILSNLNFTQYCISFQHHYLKNMNVNEPFCMNFHTPSSINIEWKGSTPSTSISSSNGNNDVVTDPDIRIDG